MTNCLFSDFSSLGHWCVIQLVQAVNDAIIEENGEEDYFKLKDETNFHHCPLLLDILIAREGLNHAAEAYLHA